MTGNFSHSRERRRGARAPGFTLIELMIVVAIIGILAAIAIPKFAALIRKSQEGTSKGNLGALRSTLSIYYGDMEGQYPGVLYGLTLNSKYLGAIPPAYVPNYHGDNSTSGGWLGGCSPDFASDDGFSSEGSWAYCATPTDVLFGSLAVNCTHTDTKGSVWSSY
jgi:prepilin-type N-terminal cleavage/methylation domain-containing protein